MELALPPHLVSLERPMTVDEFMQLPEGPPYPELIDGELVMNPSPTGDHQIVVVNLTVLLHAACPADLRVMLGPYGWAAGTHEVFEPDLLVVDRRHVVGHLLRQRPLLCVEILSPSNRRQDLVRKRLAYERAGVPSYWIIDPASSDGPTVVVLELVDGVYVDNKRRGANTAPFTNTRPFPITIDPARLLD